MSATAKKHLRDVQRLFDDWASEWSHKYDGTGELDYRIAQFSEALAAVVKQGARVLDFGCGSGHITSAIAGQGYRVTGCDMPPEMLLEADKNTKEPVEFVLLDPQNRSQLPFPKDHFDAIYASSVFEYIDDPEFQFKEIAQVLRPGGHFLITVPDLRDAFRQGEIWKRRLSQIDFVWWVLKHTSKKRVAHYLRVSKNWWELDEWKQVLERAGFHRVTWKDCTGPLVMIGAERR